MPIAMRGLRNGARSAAMIGMLSLSSISSAHAGDAPPLVPEAAIVLPHTSGRIDHLAIDRGRKRLFVAELGNGTVDVVDLDRRQVIHRLTRLKEPQGVLYAPFADRLVVASAGDGTVRLFSAGHFAEQAVIRLGGDADNIRLGPDGRDALIGYGNGGLAVIDLAQGIVRTKIPLAAHPEGFQVTPEKRAYINVPDSGRITVADLNARKVVATWTFPGLSGNFPMALGEGGTVAVVSRAPARFVRIDRATGREVSENDACGDADDVFFDAKRRRYYVSCGEGLVETFEVADGRVTALAPVVTSQGARTSLFVPEVDRLFVAERGGLLGSDASIRVMRPAP
jgi:DNA-binding beta-propeller fold protein YncE